MVDLPPPTQWKRVPGTHREVVNGVSYKWCSRGQHWVPDTEFHNHNRHTSDGLRHECKSCGTQEHLLPAPEEYREFAQRINRPTRGQFVRFKNNLKKNYKLTIDEYKEMLELQDYKCAICDEDLNFTGSTKHIHVDHCHNSSKVRGILCRQCNHMLGCAKDNPKILKKAITYLKKDQTIFQFFGAK